MDRATRLSLFIPQRCAVSQHMAGRAVVEGDAELEVLHVCAARSPLGGQLIKSQLSPVLERPEMAGPDFNRCRQRSLGAARYVQQFVCCAVTSNAEAFGVMGNKHRRRHSIKKRRQFRRPLLLAPHALPQRLLRPLALGDVLGEYYDPTDLPSRIIPGAYL